MDMFEVAGPGIILWMHQVNEKQRYIVTSSLIDLAHSQNYPCGHSVVLYNAPVQWFVTSF